MKRNRRIEEIGDIGEDILKLYLESTEQYATVQRSPNKFDSEKDIIAVAHDGKIDKIECKTKTLIFSFKPANPPAMCIEQSQWKKIDAADRVFFLNCPRLEDEKLCIYELIDKENFIQYRDYGRDKDNVRFYPIATLKPHVMVNDMSINKKLYDLSVSGYKG